VYRSLAIWDGLRLGFRQSDLSEKFRKNFYQQSLVEEKEGTCPAFPGLSREKKQCFYSENYKKIMK